MCLFIYLFLTLFLSGGESHTKKKEKHLLMVIVPQVCNHNIKRPNCSTHDILPTALPSKKFFVVVRQLGSLYHSSSNKYQKSEFVI